jgi:hypothetical protein
MLRRLSALILGGLLVVGAACSGGEKSSGGDSDATAGPARALFQPPGVVGPDSFAPSFDLATYEVTDEDAALSGTVDSSTPGLYRGRTYGGTGTNICDVEKMIEFLTYYEDRGRAWAEIQGIPFETLPEYLRSLTPVFVTQDINVRMYGFKDGAAYGYDAVIGAGTALLIDDQGIPRARCACGNPLLPPSPEETPSTEPSSEATTTVPTITTTETEPACPEISIAGEWTDYVTTEGVTWRYIPATGQWMNVDDPTAALVNELAEIPGYVEQCPPPSTPDDPCPTEELGATWTDSNGDMWTWSSDTTGGANWTRVEDGALLNSSTSELPGVSPNCVEPTVPTESDCPEEIQGTRHVDEYGTEWIYTGSEWWASIDGQNVTLSSAELFGEECGEPACPPYKARLGDDYVDQNGDRWTFDYHGNDTPAWDNTNTDEVEALSNEELPQSEDCAPPIVERRPCPPVKAVVGDTWTSPTGRTWVFGTDGGAAGWDDLATSEVEHTPTVLLPETENCRGPLVVNCPELEPLNGSAWITPNGSIFIYSYDLGVWIEVSDPNVTIPHTALLPGYVDECLPPCPPIQMSSEESGAWVDPMSGHVWVWSGDTATWTNLVTGTTVETSLDLPWYRGNCLPPCPPDGESEEQEQSWTTLDGTVVSSEAVDRLRDVKREPVTITAGTPNISLIDIARMRPTVAVLDDCNEEGCLATDESPQEGHLFTDSNGVDWRFGGDGLWYAEDGNIVTTASDIPGYDEICNPESTPESTPCPPEFEGSSYTDSNGITWSWVWFNSDEADSDHGAHWLQIEDDGTRVYRYTHELEDDGRFADCAPATETTTGDLAIDVRAKGPVCAGISMYVVANITATEGSTLSSVTFEFDGSPVEATAASDSAFFAYVYSETPGTFTVTVTATDTSGASGTATLDVTFDECDQPRSTTEVEPNLTIRLRAKAPVCVGNFVSFSFTVTPTPGAAVNEVGADLAGTYIEVNTSNATTWSGRVTSDVAGTFVLTAGATDTAGAVASTSLDVTFTECASSSTSVARPVITLVPSIPPITFQPTNPSTTISGPVVTLTPSIPSITVRPIVTTTTPRSTTTMRIIVPTTIRPVIITTTTTTTTTTTPAGTYAGAVPSNQNKVCVENLDTTGTGRLYITTPVAMSALTATVGTANRIASKVAPLRWVVLVDRVDVGKSLKLTGTRASDGGSLSGSITVPKGCGD